MKQKYCKLPRDLLRNRLLYARYTDEDFLTIPGFEKYEINRNGVIRHKKTKHITKCRIRRRPTDQYIVALVKTSTPYNRRLVLIINLLLSTFNPDNANIYDRNIFYFDEDYSNFKLNNIFRVVTMEYFLNRYYPGYRQIEDSNYCINIEGRVFNMITGHLLLCPINKKGYLRFTSKVPFPTKTLHRLLGIVFIPIPDHLKDYDISELDVHHKNEDKLDNSIDLNDLYGPETNLEWVHRFHHLSHHNSKVVKILDILTGNVTIYPNAITAAKMLGITKQSISSYILKSNRKSIVGRYHAEYINSV